VTAAAQTVTVSILGKEYQVACVPEQYDELLRAARQLDERMREIRNMGNVVGLERIAVMAALNLSNELLLAQRSSAEAELIERLNKKLDAATGESQ
jgi:cell division protein ZapA